MHKAKVLMLDPFAEVGLENDNDYEKEIRPRLAPHLIALSQWLLPF